MVLGLKDNVSDIIHPLVMLLDKARKLSLVLACFILIPRVRLDHNLPFLFQFNGLSECRLKDLAGASCQREVLDFQERESLEVA